MLQQAFDLWITPEVEKRKAAGTLPEPFHLFMAQRIQRPDGTTLVRFNDEVRGVANARASRPVAMGEQLVLSDLEHLTEFDVPDDELDCGHWTIIRTEAKWFTSFNFLSNRAKCIDLLSKSKQFAEGAAQASEKGHQAVAVDTLFSACELIAKAYLVSSNMVPLENRTHGPLAGNINRQRKMGNVHEAFVDLFNRMQKLRPRYRYDAQFSDATPVTDDDIGLVHAMIEASIARLESKVR